MSEVSLKPFITWFQKNGGKIDLDSLGFTTFPVCDGGRGAVALKDIPEEHVLFSIPRSLTLSTRTSSLPPRLGIDVWKRMKMDQGWTGLILCMMWESANGNSSSWSEYFNILPARFDTPMFWSDVDLAELHGTSVVGLSGTLFVPSDGDINVELPVEKLGREEAEQSYTEKMLPVIQSRPDLFPPEKIEHYSLANYHLMGSRILSRSFNVEKWESEEGQSQPNESIDTREDGMDVDSSHSLEGDGNVDDAHHSEVEDEDDEEDASDTAMVPMADMLNARYGSENAKLFDDEHELRMISTKPIKLGEQIWNTYGDLPNAELLRRYGHVDLLPLVDGAGNPGDVVEIRADIAVSATTQRCQSLSSDHSQERIDWWLEEGGDDVFVLESDLELPEPLISLIRLLLLNQEDWDVAKTKGKPPKPKVDADVLNIVHDVLDTRLKAYRTTLEEDEARLSGQITLNARHAIIVRMGEKRILNNMLVKVRLLQSKGVGKDNKRKASGNSAGSQKRSRN